jgi:hypothetical protein
MPKATDLTHKTTPQPYNRYQEPHSNNRPRVAEYMPSLFSRYISVFIGIGIDQELVD